MALVEAGLDVEAASVPYIASWAVDGDDVLERDAGSSIVAFVAVAVASTRALISPRSLDDPVDVGSR